MLVGWKAYALGGAVLGAVAFGAGAKVGAVFTTADLQPQLTTLTAEIARLNKEKAAVATAALGVLNELATASLQAQADAETARADTMAAAEDFRTGRAARITPAQAVACTVSDADADAARMLDSRLFSQPD